MGFFRVKSNYPAPRSTMPQTKAEILAEQQAKLDAAFLDPNITDKRHLLVQLAEVIAVIGGNNSTANGGGTSTDITAGIDGSVDIESIKGLLTDIKSELVNSKSIADLIIQDSGTTPRYFVRQDAIDQTTGTPTTTILNFDGSIPSPVPVLPLVPIKAGATNQVVEDLYIATIAGSGYAIGDSLSNVRLLNGETGLIIAIAWYNLTSGSTIAVAPPIANLKGYADKVEELLVSIASKLPTLGTKPAAQSLSIAIAPDTAIPLAIDASTATLQGLLNQAIGPYTDNVIPTDETVDSTIAGLLRLILQRDRATSADELTAIGNFLSDDIAPTPDAIASLKSLLRGFWRDSDPTTTRNLLNGILGNTANPNIRQLTSADSVSIASLPGTIGADILAIRAAQVTELARLTSIDNKTVAAAPTTKTTIVGFTSIANTNSNLLDPSGNGAWTDVRGFSSMEMTLVSSAFAVAMTMFVAYDAIGTGATLAVTYDATTGVQGSYNPTNGTTKVKVDIAGVNFVRVGQLNTVAGHKLYATLSQSPFTHKVNAQIAGTVPVVPVGNTTITALAPQSATDIPAGLISASSTTGAIVSPLGVSYQVTINITLITGALTQSIVKIQESPDSGVTWWTVYTFEEITVAKGIRSYKSPIITSSGNRIRYIETVTGTTPNISRTFLKSTINAPGLINQDTRSGTTYNANLAAIDIPAYGVIRAITVMPTVATPLFLQIHDTANPVVAGVQPRQSFRIPVDGLKLGADYFGDGRQLGSAITPRITISTTANTYTPIALAANTVQLYIEAI
jgi:hypothetical protein